MTEINIKFHEHISLLAKPCNVSSARNIYNSSVFFRQPRLLSDLITRTWILLQLRLRLFLQGNQWLQCSAKLALNQLLSVINYPTQSSMLLQLDCCWHPNKLKLAKISVHCISTVLHWKSTELSCFKKHLPQAKSP